MFCRLSPSHVACSFFVHSLSDGLHRIVTFSFHLNTETASLCNFILFFIQSTDNIQREELWQGKTNVTNLHNHSLQQKNSCCPTYCCKGYSISNIYGCVTLIFITSTQISIIHVSVSLVITWRNENLSVIPCFRHLC